MAKVKVLNDQEIHTRYFDDDKDSGFKFRMPTPDLRTEWENKFGKVRTQYEQRRGFRQQGKTESVFEFNRPAYFKEVWDRCIIEVFGLVDGQGQDVPFDKNMLEQRRIFWPMLSDMVGMIEEAEAQYMAQKNDTDPLSKVPSSKTSSSG